MKLLYIAFHDFSNCLYGVSKKIFSECRAFEKMGYEVTLIGRSGSNSVIVGLDNCMEILRENRPYKIDLLNKLIDKEKQCIAVKEYMQTHSFDICYIRYDLSTPTFINMLKTLRNGCKKIVIEIPTYPYRKEYAHTKFPKIRLWLDDKYGKKLHKYVDFIISFYEVENESFYGVPVIQVPNGFDFSEINIVEDSEVPQDIHVAAVSSMREWHGYERFIEGLNCYYSSKGEKRNVFFHLVGNGPEYTKYWQLTEKYQLQKHVIFHGPMQGKELDDLLNMCSLGVDSLARHRSGVDLLSSLKSREYGAKGIPFINSCRIDIIEDGYPFCYFVPADESPIDIDQIVKFYDRIFASGNRLEVAYTLRKYVESKADMYAVIRMILERINQ